MPCPPSPDRNNSQENFLMLDFYHKIILDRKVEMVSFELGEELRKMFFRLVASVGQRKNPKSP